MSHYAKIENGFVVQVIVSEQDFIDTQSGIWVQTSYNTHGGQHILGGSPLRKNFAGVGMVYDSTRDAFYTPQPYPSWTLHEETCEWKSPAPLPSDASDDKQYTWNEDTTSWIEVT
tara:strand:- start:241 stop:585 length:345 start_codon:yes stop_codon:yes gene_type:complete